MFRRVDPFSAGCWLSPCSSVGSWYVSRCVASVRSKRSFEFSLARFCEQNQIYQPTGVPVNFSRNGIFVVAVSVFLFALPCDDFFGSCPSTISSAFIFHFRDLSISSPFTPPFQVNGPSYFHVHTIYTYTHARFALENNQLNVRLQFLILLPTAGSLNGREFYFPERQEIRMYYCATRWWCSHHSFERPSSASVLVLEFSSLSLACRNRRIVGRADRPVSCISRELCCELGARFLVVSDGAKPDRLSFHIVFCFLAFRRKLQTYCFYFRLKFYFLLSVGFPNLVIFGAVWPCLLRYP